jgi:hypothetical protein
MAHRRASSVLGGSAITLMEDGPSLGARASLVSGNESMWASPSSSEGCESYGLPALPADDPFIRSSK